MDIGIGVAVAGLAFSGAAVGVTVIKTRAHNGNGNGKPAYPCPAHSGIEATLAALKDGQDRIEKNIERIFHLHDEGKL